MRRHLALFTALALASADTEGELRLSLTYNDMADDDDSTTLSAHFDEPLSRVQVYHAGEDARTWTGCVKLGSPAQTARVTRRRRAASSSGVVAAAERSALWGLDERLRQLKTATATTLAAAAPLPALARSAKP